MADKEWYADGLRFSCTQCGNCCTGPPGFVWFDDREAVAMAQFVNLPVKQFLRQFAHTVDGKWTLNERTAPNGKDNDCVFLQRDEQGKALCGIYHVRPTQCKTWPFWPEVIRSERSWNVTARRCPGMAKGNEGEGKLYPIEQIRVIRDSNPTI